MSALRANPDGPLALLADVVLNPVFPEIRAVDADGNEKRPVAKR